MSRKKELILNIGLLILSFTAFAYTTNGLQTIETNDNQHSMFVVVDIVWIVTGFFAAYCIGSTLRKIRNEAENSRLILNVESEEQTSSETPLRSSTPRRNSLRESLPTAPAQKQSAEDKNATKIRRKKETIPAQKFTGTLYYPDGLPNNVLIEYWNADCLPTISNSEEGTTVNFGNGTIVFNQDGSASCKSQGVHLEIHGPTGK